LILNPFYDRGGLDKGLGLHLFASLQRVAVGFAISAVVGVALGMLVGSSRLAMRALDPLFQVLRTVPPLAWLPLSLAAFREAQPSAIFVIFITAVWPIIINTAVGVRNVPADYLNVARVIRLSPFDWFLRIVVPAAAPYIFTGLRIGVGLSWLAIIAAEMLIGGVGIGFFVWDAWNSSNLSDIIVALAEGRPLERRLMACMAQLDCGQCGYLCQTYAEALATGTETSAALCVPGAKPTLKALKALLAEAPAAAPKPTAKPAAPAGRAVRFVTAHRLTGAGSAKDVRHVVLDLAASGLTYEPGDSLSVVAPNDPRLVDAVLAALGAPGDATLRDELLHRRDIARPLDRTLDLLAGAAKHPPHAAALRALADGDDGAEPADADLLDLLSAFPSARPPLVDLLASLPTLKPRL
jgi:nitrate ABC transporter permease subunit